MASTPLNRAALERPFPPNNIRSRRGAFGRDLHYVEGHHYVRRLNEAFDGDWSWQVLHHEVHGTEVVVLGVLEAGGTRKHAFGGSTVTTASSNGAVVSLADDFKAAATDALKKASSLLGVGLELYDDSLSAEPRSTSRVTASAGTTQPADSNRDARDNGSGNAHARTTPGNEERQRLTVRQLRALYAIGHGKGMSDRTLRSLCIERFEAAPEFLSRQQASMLIDELGAS
jgi:hypothetical protein